MLFLIVDARMEMSVIEMFSNYGFRVSKVFSDFFSSNSEFELSNLQLTLRCRSKVAVKQVKCSDNYASLIVL